MEQDWVRLIQVFHAAVERAVEGQKKYGNWTPENCRRSLWKEAEEELLDTMVYCGLQILKLRHMERELTHKPAPTSSSHLDHTLEPIDIE